jgi:hypothetical protein
MSFGIVHKNTSQFNIIAASASIEFSFLSQTIFFSNTGFKITSILAVLFPNHIRLFA